MGGSSHWDRLARGPYKALGLVLFLVGAGSRFLTFLPPEARNLVGLPLLIAGVVILSGPWWYRVRKEQDEEIRRNPTGKTVPLDDRLANVNHPRARWFMSAVLAVIFGLATVWAIYAAATKNDSAYVGMVILAFLPFPLFCWLTWRTRALLNRRP